MHKAIFVRMGKKSACKLSSGFGRVSRLKKAKERCSSNTITISPPPLQSPLTSTTLPTLPPSSSFFFSSSSSLQCSYRCSLHYGHSSLILSRDQSRILRIIYFFSLEIDLFRVREPWRGRQAYLYTLNKGLEVQSRVIPQCSLSSISFFSLIVSS